MYGLKKDWRLEKNSGESSIASTRMGLTALCTILNRSFTAFALLRNLLNRVPVCRIPANLFSLGRRFRPGYPPELRLSSSHLPEGGSSPQYVWPSAGKCYRIVVPWKRCSGGQTFPNCSVICRNTRPCASSPVARADLRRDLQKRCLRLSVKQEC